MSIIDRILSGDFDEENDSIEATAHPSDARPDSDEEEESPAVDPDNDDEEPFEDEVDPEEEQEENEEDEDLEDDISNSADADVPSVEYCAEYVRQQDLIGAAPKCSTVKTKEAKPAKPKNSTNPIVDPAVKRGRGRPHKLTAHAAEVTRLYEEGVGTKALAEKFGVSVSCVINCLKVNNIQVRPKGRQRKST